MMTRLFASFHDKAPRLIDDLVTALVAVGAFGVAGSLWRACVAVVAP